MRDTVGYLVVLGVMGMAIAFSDSDAAPATKNWEDVTETWLRNTDDHKLVFSEAKEVVLTPEMLLIFAEKRDQELVLLFVVKSKNQELVVKGFKGQASMSVQPNMADGKRLKIVRNKHTETFVKRGLFTLFLPFSDEMEESQGDDNKDDTIGTDKDPVLKPLSK